VLRLKKVGLQLERFSLKNITLNVEKQEYLVLLGPTGAGKTVLLETIAGIHYPDQGKIFLNDQDATYWPPEERRLGVVYQDYALFPHLNVYDNIAFGLRLRGETISRINKTVLAIASFMEISPLLKRRIRFLSGGERQRTALARALVFKPRLLLLDEPLSALDSLTRDRLQRELKRIQKQLGIAVLHITHDLKEAFYLADRMLVMNEGQILQQGKIKDLLTRPENRVVAELLGIKNIIPVKEGKGEQVFLNGLGPVNQLETINSKLLKNKSYCLTIPSWAIELKPNEDAIYYLWKGQMKIIEINQMKDYMDIELQHFSGQRLNASLSYREMFRLSPFIKVNQDIEVALLRNGIHWVPASPGGHYLYE